MKIGNNYNYFIDEEMSGERIAQSWNVDVKKETRDGNGLRIPQFGALSAIQAHWTISKEAATIVMPTGTGNQMQLLRD